MKIDLANLTVKKTGEHLLKGDFSAEELSEAYLRNIRTDNPDVFAYLEVFEDVLKQAQIADEKIRQQKKVGPLTGIPLALKDNIMIKGKKVSAGSKMLENFVSPYDSTVSANLRRQGAIILGRTNMDEFAMGSSTENSAYGVTKNPHDLERVPGGSSGGSAAAVAKNMALASFGSDTGGSVRQPASFCGVVGLKPTYGAFSRNGLIAMGSSLDQIGPIAKSVSCTEIMFEELRGHDPLDSTSLPDDFYKDYQKNKKENSKNLKEKVIGIPVSLIEREGVDEGVLKNFRDSIKKLKDAGFKTKEVDLLNMHYALAAYYIIMPAEVSANLARFDGIKYGASQKEANLMENYLKTRGKYFGREVRRRILVGTYILSSGYYDEYYSQARKARNVIISDFQKVFEEVDVVLSPTTPTPAFALGEKVLDPIAMYFSDIFTVPANIAGVPAISIPSGFIENGGKKLPLGVQFVAPYAREDLLFAFGKIFLNE